MISTIYSFTEALLRPTESFATLHDAKPCVNSDDRIRIYRSARFAETEIEWQGTHWLLCMPLTMTAITDVERTAAHLKTLRSEWLSEYRLLRGEMRYEDSTGTEHHSDLILQSLPAGCPFAEALATEQPKTLLAALDALSAELNGLGISHRNLKAINLRWSNGRLIPIRHHYTCCDTGRDTEALAALRAEILCGAEPRQTAHDVQAPYGTPHDRLTGHRWTGHAFEQLICVEDEAGYGYVDAENRVVIPSQFLWADDFHEGRAAVETQAGMGLINKQGRYVIPAQYEIVEYDASTGRSQVRQHGLWAEFDYEGRPLEEFRKRT